MTDWTPDIVQELRAQGLKVKLRTPQDASWCVEDEYDKYIVTISQMEHLKAHGRLNIEGIKELDKILSRHNP